MWQPPRRRTDADIVAHFFPLISKIAKQNFTFFFGFWVKRYHEYSTRCSRAHTDTSFFPLESRTLKASFAYFAHVLFFCCSGWFWGFSMKLTSIWRNSNSLYCSHSSYQVEWRQRLLCKYRNFWNLSEIEIVFSLWNQRWFFLEINWMAKLVFFLKIWHKKSFQNCVSKQSLLFT